MSPFFSKLQCCGHIINSKATLAKRKEAQKLSQWAIKKIEALTAGGGGDTNNKKGQSSGISALENAFGGLDIKGN